MIIASGLRRIVASDMLLMLYNDDNEGAADYIVYDLFCHNFPIENNGINYNIYANMN